MTSFPSRAQAYNPFEHLFLGLFDLPNTQNFIVLGIGSAATAAAFVQYDEEIIRHFSKRQWMNNKDRWGNEILGKGIVGVGIGVTSILLGAAFSSSREIEQGVAHLEAIAVTAGITEGLKRGTKRQRPNDYDNLSFPSGHTSTIFCSAMVMQDFYGPLLGIPMFFLAGYTGVARLVHNSHHLSDVLAGATLGMLVGHAYSLHHRRSGGLSSTSDNLPRFLVRYETRRDFHLSVEFSI